MYFLSEKPKYILLEKVLAWSGYLLFILTTGVIGTLIILHYSGYSFSKSGVITRTGFVTVTSSPVKANVFLDGKQLKGQTYMRLDIPVGAHDFVVRANGYQEWTRNLTIEPSGVYWLDYILLYPKNLTPYALQNLPNYQQVRPLRGQDSLMGYNWDSTNLDISLIDLKNRSNDNITPNHFSEADLSLGFGDKITSLELMKIDRTEKSMLFKINTESGSNLLFYDTEKPNKILNISKKYSINPDKVDFTYDDYHQIHYVDTENNLRILNLETDSISKPLISVASVSDFIVKNQDKVYYINNQNDLFIKKYSTDESELISRLATNDSPHKINLVSYNSTDYLIDHAGSVTNPNNSTLNIWAIDGNKISNKFSTELDGLINNIVASKDANSIFAITNNGDLASFVFKDSVSGQFKIKDFKSDIDWASNFQISYIAADGFHLVDFTGDNNKLIIPGLDQSSYIVSKDLKNIYYTEKSKDINGLDNLEINSIDMLTK